MTNTRAKINFFQCMTASLAFLWHLKSRFFSLSEIFETGACHHQMDTESDPQRQGLEHRLCRLDQRWQSIDTVSIVN